MSAFPFTVKFVPSLKAAKLLFSEFITIGSAPFPDALPFTCNFFSFDVPPTVPLNTALDSTDGEPITIECLSESEETPSSTVELKITEEGAPDVPATSSTSLLTVTFPLKV